MASTMSSGAEDNKDYIKAYEVLANLTPSQQKVVAERLASLKDHYIEAASQTARDLERINIPIKGVANEVAVQRARKQKVGGLVGGEVLRAGDTTGYLAVFLGWYGEPCDLIAVRDTGSAHRITEVDDPPHVF